jgi:hypothetical protein
MDAAAATPEELETLLEDAFLRRDASAVADLFEHSGVLVTDRPAHGRTQIGHAADRVRGYLAEPRQVWQAGDTALLLGAGAVNVARRECDGGWRFAICVLDEGRD